MAVIETMSSPLTLENPERICLSQAVRCMKCLHDWVANFPVGDDLHCLECPKCFTKKTMLLLGTKNAQAPL